MEKLEEITLYRFRVRTVDGREAVSQIVATRRVPKAHLAGSEEEVLSAEDERKARAMLANPRWSAELFADGDHAALLVDAAGLDGRTVRFDVEHRDGEEWRPYEKLEAKVENGVAQARLQLHHHKRDAALAELRFSCEFV
jgi:demethoxyubiquinone hydroxylase (CLK1/Coq7/Cat5 family)